MNTFLLSIAVKYKDPFLFVFCCFYPWPPSPPTGMVVVPCVWPSVHHAVCLVPSSRSLLNMAVFHYDDVIMTAIASQITSLTIVYSTVYSGEYQRKHQSSASLALVRGLHRGLVNSPHKWPATRKMFPFDDVIMFGHFLWVQWNFGNFDDSVRWLVPHWW